MRAALLSSGLGWPQRRMTVNLAPSGIRKIGASPDLAEKGIRAGGRGHTPGFPHEPGTGTHASGQLVTLG